MPDRKPDLPPEIREILDKLFSLLDSDEAQNRTLPPEIRTAITKGLPCDVLPNATGEFGRVATNPIPTNGPIGEVLYLSRLRTSAGSPVMFHRVRSEAGLTNAVDVYEALSLDGEVKELLYLSMYHPRKSRCVPDGYSYAAELDTRNFIYGVNHIVPDFPQKLDAYVRKWQRETIGVPLPVGRIRKVINGSAFSPSVLTDVESMAQVPRKANSVMTFSSFCMPRRIRRTRARSS